MTLKDLRKEKRMTQADLAQALGVNPRSVSRYETGERKVRPATAEKIRTIFNLSVDDAWDMFYRTAS